MAYIPSFLENEGIAKDCRNLEDDNCKLTDLTKRLEIKKPN